jgi:hypothetical protein
VRQNRSEGELNDIRIRDVSVEMGLHEVGNEAGFTKLGEVDGAATVPWAGIDHVEKSSNACALPDVRAV